MAGHDLCQQLYEERMTNTSAADVTVGRDREKWSISPFALFIVGGGFVRAKLSGQREEWICVESLSPLINLNFATLSPSLRSLSSPFFFFAKTVHQRLRCSTQVSLIFARIVIIVTFVNYFLISASITRLGRKTVNSIWIFAPNVNGWITDVPFEIDQQILLSETQSYLNRILSNLIDHIFYEKFYESFEHQLRFFLLFPLRAIISGTR